jgi:uncharacterized repeat protein (TIGR01451 family)
LDPNLANGEKISNHIAVLSDTPDPDPKNNLATHDTEVRVGADVSVDMVGVPASVNVGDLLTYVIVLQNNDPSSVVESTVIETRPEELEHLSYTASVTGEASVGNPQGEGNIDDNMVNLPPGSTVTYVVTGVVPTGVPQIFVNSVRVAAPGLTMWLQSFEVGNEDNLFRIPIVVVLKTPHQPEQT